MRKSYEEIYIYNGDDLLGLVKLFNNFSTLQNFRIYMNLSNHKLVKEY